MDYNLDDVYLRSTLQKCQVLQSNLATLCSAKIPNTGLQKLMPTPTLSPARSMKVSADVPLKLSSPPHAPSQHSSVSTSSAQSGWKPHSPIYTGVCVGIAADGQAPLVGKVGNSRTASGASHQIYSETETGTGTGFRGEIATMCQHGSHLQPGLPLHRRGRGYVHLDHHLPPLHHNHYELRDKELGDLFSVEMHGVIVPSEVNPVVGPTYTKHRPHDMSVNPNMPITSEITPIHLLNSLSAQPAHLHDEEVHHGPPLQGAVQHQLPAPWTRVMLLHVQPVVLLHLLQPSLHEQVWGTAGSDCPALIQICQTSKRLQGHNSTHFPQVHHLELANY